MLGLNSIICIGGRGVNGGMGLGLRLIEEDLLDNKRCRIGRETSPFLAVLSVNGSRLARLDVGSPGRNINLATVVVVVVVHVLLTWWENGHL